MNFNLADEINKIGQEGLTTGGQELSITESLSDQSLKKAKAQAKRLVEDKLKEYTYFERLQKTFLYDETFFIELLKECSSVERPFVVLLLNRLNLFDGSVDLEYAIFKKMSEKRVQNRKQGVIIGGVGYDEKLIEELVRASVGIIDTDLKPYLYWLSKEELLQTSSVFAEIAKTSSILKSKVFLTRKQFISQAKDLCVGLSFMRAVQSMASSSRGYIDECGNYCD